MGCFWSREGSPDKCRTCDRRAVNNLIIIDHVCEVCISDAIRRERAVAAPKRPRYGEYRCECGRHWTSRLSWINSYQICKYCKLQVYPHTQRDLRPSDMSDLKDNVMEHQKELCQMCLQLGYHCRNFKGAVQKSKIRSH